VLILDGALQSEKDLTFEEDVLRNPNSFKAWWYYLEFKVDAPPKVLR